MVTVASKTFSSDIGYLNAGLQVKKDAKKGRSPILMREIVEKEKAIWKKKQTVVASDALTKDQIRELAVKSLAGIKNSYAPYSHFHVSAVLLCGNGAVYTGNNIENAAYTPSVCAERCAFF